MKTQETSTRVSGSQQQVVKHLKWTQTDSIRAGEQGWTLRPWRYVEEDGCWTIRRTGQSPISTEDEAVQLVLRQGACRDFCESEQIWQTCHKAAQMAMGANV